ncbi:MAG: hypothetical protein FWC01_03850 [Treponema sp.]|nr:hypothetical protein [Treponema sp.]
MKKFIFFIVFIIIIVTEAFAGPFGIEFGMSLEQITQISRGSPQNVDGDWFIIIPPNEDAFFETYLIRIHQRYGVYFIRAISRVINTDQNGAELKEQFNAFAASLQRTYGNYSRSDTLIPGSNLTSPNQFMESLQREERELAAFWNRNERSRLPNDILEIIVVADASGFSTTRGHIIVNYYGIHYDRIES